MTRGLWIAALLLGSQGASMKGQEVKLPAFDVVSVRVNDKGGQGIGIDVEKNSFTATNVTLMDLMMEAYGVKSELISGGPGWVTSVRYNVQAKVLDGENVDLEKFSDKERGPILQAILVDRFQLKAHVELKTLPVYELTIAKSGAKLKPMAAATDGQALPHDGSYTVHRGELSGHGMSLASVSGVLTQIVRRKVIDKTGLAGNYDLELKWTSEEDLAAGKDNGAGGDAPPTIFTAVQEQLGLRLQSAKGPVETLVVDHVEKPTEN